MSDDRVPDDLRAFLAAERSRPELAPERVASLFDRMSATLPFADAPHAPEPPAEAPVEPPPATPEPGLALRLLQKYPAGTLIAALTLGASGGAAVTHAVESPRPVAAVASTLVQAATPTVTTLREVPPAPVSAEAPRPTMVAPSAQPTPGTAAPSARPDATGTRDADLAVERTLIERARSAMVRGNPQDALLATREHAQRFPAGRFAEERDFITIRALAASGDKARARAAADAFRLRHPQSLLLPAVDEVAP